jgi:type II secretory pathway pseudopilin PulG
MTARDRTVLIVVGLLALLGAFWFAVLSPKREEASRLTDAVAVEQQRLSTAVANAAAAEESKARYASDYATVARLGKAVPVDDQVPSLLYTLQTTAERYGVDFRNMSAESDGAAPASGSQASSAPPLSQVATQGGAASGTSSGQATDSSAAAAGTQAPAASGAAASAPVGAAGFTSVPFTFTFDGSYFNMERFLRAVDRLTIVDGQQVRIRGRLLTIDSVGLTAGSKGFPFVQAAVSATAFMLPAEQGLTAGATPQGPVPASSSTTTAPPAQTGSTPASPAPAAAASIAGGTR